MLTRSVAKLYAVILFGLALAGLLSNNYLFGLVNVDFGLDILRVILAIALGYSAFFSESDNLATTFLFAIGVLYVLMGVTALFSPQLLGLLPTSLTLFDVFFHLSLGGFAIGVSSLKSYQSSY